MSNVQRLAGLFGGITALADALGVDKSVCSRWDKPKDRRGNDGNVPTHYNHRIIDAAERLGLDQAAVAACLDQHACPCCGRDLEPGQTIDPRYLASVVKAAH